MTTWKIDPSHTDVAFSAKHLMITTVRGKFDQVEGEIVLDETNPAASSGEIRISAASLSTGFEQRDNHLRSADFFDVENNPLIVARTTGIEKKGDGYLVHTDVTIRGTTRPLTFDAEFLGVVPNMQGGRHAGFHLTAKVNREDFGLTWNMGLEAGGVLVSKEIKLEIDVAADSVVTAEPILDSAVA
jgi:polyisoprenoid-binding protein YceI